MTRIASPRSFPHVALGTAGLALLAGCSGSDSSTTGAGGISGNFVVVRTEPVNNGTIYLNDPVRIDFTRELDLDSANLNTVTFTVLDQIGQPTAELVSGSFTLDKSPGDDSVGRRLLFTPRFATSNAYDNGGFRGGRTYLVQLVGGTSLNGTAIRDRGGRALEAPVTFSFQTVEGTSPAQLYRNPKAGGPRRTTTEGLTISNTSDLQNVPLNIFGAPPTEVRLKFDQALNPNDTNVPVNFDTNPAVRSQANRGRIFLEYDDPEYGANTWIPADVALERNNPSGATVVLRPAGVLPNNADIRVIVEAELEDISGESNVGNLAYSRVFGTFHTVASYGQRFNGIADSFDAFDNIDFAAPFPEPQAVVGPGYVRAGFEFEGAQTSLEFEPNVLEVVLNTSFTQVVPKSGLPFNVSGGVFNFKNVTIPQGVLVKGQGPNPMVWLCSGNFTVAGHLSVDGGEGARVDTLNSANFSKAGGVGTCTGGNGGPGTPSASSRDLRGGTGNGGLQIPGLGGGGGRLACLAGCYTGSGYNGSGGGSGGGGGTLSTQGDPWYDNTSYTGTQFQQKRGIGGAGCSGTSANRSAVLAGGDAAPLVFTDARDDNDFWGSGIDLNPARNIRITGELAVPMGGGGGGGGGDTAHNTSCSVTDPSFANDYSGGGGGGGGGVLIVKALGTIEITATGEITANGGNGGGGEQVGACGEAGGGGAGSGGLIVLMSATKIRIHAHHDAGRYTYSGDPALPNNASTNKNYDFAISADGGICRTGTFGSPVVRSKYPGNGQTVMAGTTYDANPLGALGGMGIVQLMTPPGDNSDGTNTSLDDNIEFVLPTNAPTGIDKRVMLGWRGFPDGSGSYFDESGNVIPSTFGAGDIRPQPILLPVPFNAKSRARSKWIDTGASRRRLVATESGVRALLDNGTNVVGPQFEFAGLDNSTSTPGYVHYEQLSETAVRILYPQEVAPTAIASVSANATFLGKPAYAIELASPALGTEVDRYSQYEAELLNVTGGVVGSLRILSHDEDSLICATDGNLLPAGAERLRVVKKFFKIVTGGSEGLGRTYRDGDDTVPEANVRIGFAFHQDPQSSDPMDRYPEGTQDFIYDLTEAGFLNWISQRGTPQFVQYDVTFDMVYSHNGSFGPTLSPASPRPELQYLRLPFRF
ncbi:MAG: hypothetical protein KDE27_20480 [Planctomycetes bacterium]|nr:hypothetical protein [Planctomycetota bacterium]